MQAILRGFQRVLIFSGRDGRDQFWPYALAVFGLMTAGGTAIFLPAFGESMSRMQQFAVAHPDQAQVTAGPGSYSITVQGSHPELFPDLRPMIHGLSAVMAVAILLLATAVVRRLHDRGHAGLWGLLPLPFLAFSLWAFPQVFASVSDSNTVPPLFLPVLLSNILYLGSLGLLGFLLWGPSQPGLNRYGEMPPQPAPRPPPPPLGPRPQR